MAEWWWLLGDGRLPSAGSGVTQCSIQKLLAFPEKCFPCRVPSTHINWVCTWQLYSCMIFTCLITSPCKPREYHHEEMQPGLSDPVIKVGSPFVNLASPSHKVELRKGFVLWVLVFPRPYNTKTKKNSKGKTHIFWDKPYPQNCPTTPYALCCAMLSCSVVQLFGTPWTVCSPPAPLSMGILQARITGWVAMSSSRGSSQPKDRTQVSCIAGGFFTIWAHEYWSGYPIPSPGGSSWSRNQTGVSCIAGRFSPSWATREAPICINRQLKDLSHPLMKLFKSFPNHLGKSQESFLRTSRLYMVLPPGLPPPLL